MKALIYIFSIALMALFACNAGGNKQSESQNTDKAVKTEIANIQISGMHCANCVASVEKGVNQLDGIKDVTVTLSDSAAIVAYDGSVVDRKTIENAIEKRGYSVKYH